MSTGKENLFGLGFDDLDIDDLETIETEEEEEKEETVDGKEEEKEQAEEAGDESEEGDESGDKESEGQEEGEVKDPILVITDYLHEKGIIDKPEDFEPTDEGFEELIVNRINKGIDEYKDSLGDTSRDFIEYLEAGGDPSKFIKVYSERDFSSVKEEDIEELDDPEDDAKRDSMRKEIIRESMRLQGWSEEKINQKVKKYEDTGILASEASDALQMVVKASNFKKKEMVERKKAEAEESRENFNNWVKNTTVAIDKELQNIIGVDIPERKRKEFKEFLFKVNPKTKKTALMEKRESDPHFDIKIAFAAFGGFEEVKKAAGKKEKSTLGDMLSTGGKRTISQSKRADSKTIDLWKRAADEGI